MLSTTLKSVITVVCIAYSIMATASTLKSVIDKGEVICGIQGGISGMSIVSNEGVWGGFDVDFCKAIASAVLKDENRVDYIGLSARARFNALINHEIDVLIRNSAWHYLRDTALPVDFAGVSLYDGQGFVFHKDRGVTSIHNIKANMTICVENFSTIESNLVEFNKQHKLQLKILKFAIKSKAIATFLNGDCDAYSGKGNDLYSQINIASLDASNYIILPERISKEPLGLVVRDDDPQWTNLVRWLLFGVIEAEEKGISSANILKMLSSNDPSIRYMLGVDPGIGKALGLDDQWLYRVIASIGNYGEIFDRNFGPKSPTPMKRGLNRLWSDGGLLYSPPIY